ncbi:protein EARLY RESPONSIVE TO DEHYDRATION 15-like [Tasmannia lanceolata]|uniref:protein EARLY RESPONSIVE TO DEHYDRATION 15-like n=1 Tax=Tasmannia lanceolata TaxID=3420 RepID=UPI004063E8D8
MDVISRRFSSSLNPNAPLFVPWAYRTVEDFSDQWWDLVQSSAWFRDYWLQECFEEPEIDLNVGGNYEPAMPEIEVAIDGYKQEKEEKGIKDLVSLGSLKWPKTRFLVGPSMKQWEKAPKIVNVKVSPRTIQQPR